MASKHALEAYSNALHGELAPWGIHVSLALISPCMGRDPLQAEKKEKGGVRRACMLRRSLQL
jgi:short-subunit dehydrogenase